MAFIKLFASTRSWLHLSQTDVVYLFFLFVPSAIAANPVSSTKIALFKNL